MLLVCCYNISIPDPTPIPNNAEIDKALKEFEAKSQTEQIPQAPGAVKTPEIPIAPSNIVEGVKFETDSYKAVKYYDETATPKVIKLVMKFSGGAIKEERQAEYILLGFVIVAIVISLFLFFNTGPSQQKPTTEALEQMKQFQQNLNK